MVDRRVPPRLAEAKTRHWAEDELRRYEGICSQTARRAQEAEALITRLESEKRMLEQTAQTTTMDRRRWEEGCQRWEIEARRSAMGHD